MPVTKRRKRAPKTVEERALHALAGGEFVQWVCEGGCRYINLGRRPHHKCKHGYTTWTIECYLDGEYARTGFVPYA